MGIKPSYIKNLGTALLAKQRENFTNNFDENKKQAGIVSSYRQQACPEPRRRLHHKKNKCQKTHITSHKNLFCEPSTEKCAGFVGTLFSCLIFGYINQKAQTLYPGLKNHPVKEYGCGRRKYCNA